MTNDFFKLCESGTVEQLKQIIKTNEPGINYDGAMVAAKHDNLELYKHFVTTQSSTLWAANSQNRREPLPETNKCLQWALKEIKIYDRKETIRSGFEDFKIMGGLAVGLLALLTVDAVKVTGELIQMGLDKAETFAVMHRLRDTSPSKNSSLKNN